MRLSHSLCTGGENASSEWSFLQRNINNKKPARRLACGSGAFERYVAVAAYYVDLFGRPDDSPALGANVLDAAVLAGAASAALYGNRGFFAVIVIIVALYLDLKGGFAAGGEILHTRLLGQPFGGFFGQGRYRPSVGAMMLDVKAVGFGGGLEFLVVVIAVVACILDLMDRLNGISVPFGGISWDKDISEKDRIKHLFFYLESKRILTNPIEMEIANTCVEAVLEIKNMLISITQDVEFSNENIHLT